MTIMIPDLWVGPEHIQQRVFGRDFIGPRGTHRARSVAQLLHCAVWARAAALAPSGVELTVQVRAGLALLTRTGTNYSDAESGASALFITLSRRDPTFWADVARHAAELTPLSAVRLRVAFLFAVQSDTHRLRLMRILPEFIALETPQLERMTLSNQIEGLQRPAVRSARHDLVGTAAPTSPTTAGRALSNYAIAKTHEGKYESELPRKLSSMETRQHAEREGIRATEVYRLVTDGLVVVLHIPRLESFDNIVLFHIPSQGVRTQTGRQLLRRLGAIPFMPRGTPGWFRVPAAELDFLNYTAMRRPESAHGSDEWLNHEIALTPPAYDNPYPAEFTRMHGRVAYIG
jgi:hypothetical protein